MQAAEKRAESGTLKSVGEDGAYSYCSKIYGYSGPTLIAANAGVPGTDPILEENFKRCRYFTHMAEAIMMGLEQTLEDDGGTDGGCHELPIIYKEDHQGQCPVGRLTEGEEEGIALVAFVFINILLVFGFVSLFYCACICCRHGDGSENRGKQHQEMHPLQETVLDGRADPNMSMELPEIT